MVYAERIIKKALKEAGNLLMERFGGIIESREKENQSSIVTEMDLAAEKTITRLITAKFPGHTIIGEEKGAVFTGSDYTWIIDPLDGTSNYANGIPWFGVLIALLHHGQPVAGGAYLPVSRQLYYAEKGKGTTLNNQPASVTKEQNLKNVLFGYATDYASDLSRTRYEADLLVKVLQHVRNIRATNCLLDFCHVIDGRFGGTINHSCKIWDIAALKLIIEEAGGFLVNLDQSEINFDISPTGYTKTYKVVAGSKQLKSQILDMIKI